MEAIIFIGTNKFGSSRDAIKAAHKLGYYTILFTDREKIVKQRVEYSDVHLMITIDISDIQKMKKKIVKLQLQGILIKGIVSFIDQRVLAAAILAEEFCEHTFMSKSIKIMESKLLTRLHLKDLAYTPKFSTIHKEDQIESTSPKIYPFILKAPHSTASKDVHLVRNQSEFSQIVQKLFTKFPSDPILMEEYIDGDQFLIEVMVINGTPCIIAVIEQEISNDNQFVITGYKLLLEPLGELQKELETIVKEIVSLLKISNGTLHLELRKSNDELKIIEINPRISGGAMNRIISFAYGFNYVEETIKLLLGGEPNIIPLYRRPIFTQYISLALKGYLHKITGKNRALRHQGILEVYTKPQKGTKIFPTRTMGQRYGYIIATGETADEARQNAKIAAEEIEFKIIPSKLHG